MELGHMRNYLPHSSTVMTRAETWAALTKVTMVFKRSKTQPFCRAAETLSISPIS